MEKDQLIGQINVVRNTFIVGLAAATLVADDRATPLLDSSSVTFGQIKIEFPGLKKWISENRSQVIHLPIALARLLVGDTFESIRVYCDKTNQRDRFEDQSWYPFANRLRDILYHGGLIGCRNSGDKIEWSGVRIFQESHGKYLSFDVFPPGRIWQLFSEMDNFAKTNLV